MTQPEPGVVERFHRRAAELAEETALMRRLLDEHIYWLRCQVRAEDALSRPCPPGRWRWADTKNQGYSLKNEEELAADRERARQRAAQFREELIIAERTRIKLGEPHDTPR